MQILALIGSYRKNGNTAHIVELILRHMQQVAAQNGVPLDVETINLAQADVQPCKGCRVCMDRGEAFWPVKDDLPAIKARMQAADGLLVASPVYVDDVSGTIKI